MRTKRDLTHAIASAISEELRIARVAAGITQTALALACRHDRQLQTDYDGGRRRYSWGSMVRACEVIGVEPGAVLTAAVARYRAESDPEDSGATDTDDKADSQLACSPPDC